jgi:DNA-directed RNA polymerase II subunit RPB11
MNAPPRYESYVLEDGEKPVEVIEDTKIPNAATIKIVKQDHTLANMLRAQLLATPQVLFAGYKVPHPLQPYFLIKVQTDGSVTPTAVLETACTKLIGAFPSASARDQGADEAPVQAKCLLWKPSSSASFPSVTWTLPFPRIRMALAVVHLHGNRKTTWTSDLGHSTIGYTFISML